MNISAFQKTLVEQGFIAQSRLNEALKRTSEKGACLWEIACEFDDLYSVIPKAVEEICGIKPFLFNGGVKPAVRAADFISADFAYKHRLIPVTASDDELVVAFADPFDTNAYEELGLLSPMRIKPMFTPWADMQLFLDRYYGKDRLGDITTRFLAEEPESKTYQSALNDDADVQNSPAVKILESVLDMAVIKNASDIHFEPMKNDTRIRFRIDGRLTEHERIGKRLHSSVISRLKVMGGMDIAEKRLPQDGRFIDNKNNIKIDFRLSTVPALYGEKAVIRMLYEKPAFLHKTELGFSESAVDVLNKLFRSAYGAILLTGPTGSGKSTTMAAFLRELSTDDNNIITIEDPVENVIDGVNHININPKAGFTFPYALRSILRQDPDIIMVGEIREPDTAKLAINSALTGHLVLSTLHTNDAISAIYRLIDMDVADYLVYAAVRGVVSQRLVRRLCPLCKRGVNVSHADSMLYGLTPGDTVYEAVGCDSCAGAGYAGRFAIYEILIVDDALLRMFAEKKSYEQIKAHLQKKGMKTLKDCGVEAAAAGETSLFELARTITDAF